MITKKGINTEIKFSKVVCENNQYFIVEFDKEGIELDKYTIEEILEPYCDKKFTKFKIEYAEEI